MSGDLLMFPMRRAVLPRVWATACGATAEPVPVGEKLEVMGVIGRAAVRIGPKRVVRMRPAAVRAPEPRVVNPELAFYRKYTEGMLRRYARLSTEYGRTPSLLGRELFRGKVTSYRISSFEDVVIFVHDMGNRIAKLDRGQQELIRRIAIQAYTQGETAKLLHMSLRSVTRQYHHALDELTAALLKEEMLEPLHASR